MSNPVILVPGPTVTVEVVVDENTTQLLTTGVPNLYVALAGDQGPIGIQGTQGVQGIQGPQGTQGTQGLFGIQGIQGIQGLQGTQGTQGLTGIQGFTGIQGLQGLQGIQGVQGTDGIQGLEGSQGIQGLEGLQGIQGLEGPQGIQGLDGIQGLQGLQGFQGLTGSTGSQGIQGLTGNQGLQGIQGLTGSTGSQGTQGIQGTQGTQGIQGIQGTSVSTSYNTYLAKTTILTGDPGSGFITWNNATQTSSTEIRVSHLTDAGVDIDVFLALLTTGDKLTIQDRGNSNNYQQWQVSSSITITPNLYVTIPVTLITSAGTGTSGFSNNFPLIFATTAAGIQGIQGTQGITGSGSQGTQGIQGITGTGSQGTQGIQGITGTGSQGTQGIQGLDGSQGTTGSGSQGIQGIQGPSGSGGGGGGGLTYLEVNSNFNAVSMYGYIINTTSGAVTATLPATPTDGVQIRFVDPAQTWSTNNVTIARNGQLINNVAENLVLDVDSAAIELVYSDIYGWVLNDVTSFRGFTGPQGVGVPPGGTVDQVLTKLSSNNYDTAWRSTTSFETVNKNLKAYAATYAYSGGILQTITYNIPPSSTIVKTFNYTGGVLTSIVLSGATPGGIQLTKTFGYTTGSLTSVTYS